MVWWGGWRGDGVWFWRAKETRLIGEKGRYFGGGNEEPI